MADLTPYILFPGTAREALSFYAEMFGGEVQLNTLAEMNRTDGPSDAIAHGSLTGGPVSLFGADAGDQPAFKAEGQMFALLGTTDPATLRQWFARLAEGGEVVDDLQLRPWGAHDGVVVDRYGLKWLIGYEGEES
jgi:PhnB protein